jgi:hypothetical protein
MALVTLMTFSFLQITRVIRRVDLAISSMIPSVFEVALKPLLIDDITRFTFDQATLEIEIERHLTIHLNQTPITFITVLDYFDQETLATCINNCDAVNFAFHGLIMHVWEFNRTATLFVSDYEANNN